MNRISRTYAALRGFTLIELLVVILILGILAAMIVPKVINRAAEAKVTATKADLSAVKSALDHFHLDCDRYPTTDEGLGALSSPPSDVASKWKGPYVQQEGTVDAWGNPIVYQCPGNGGADSYIVKSYGSDGQEGGEGDKADIIDYSN